jgi:hypothetical protein
VNEHDAAAPTGELDELDATILTGVRRVWEAADPMPAGLVDQIQFAIDLGAVDLEVSRLIDTQLAGAARSDEHTTVITFESPSLTIMITIEQHAKGTSRMDGWLTPGESHEVELRQHTTSLSATADGNGRFSFDAVPSAMTQLIVTMNGDSRRVLTPSFDVR